VSAEASYPGLFSYLAECVEGVFSEVHLTLERCGIEVPLAMERNPLAARIIHAITTPKKIR
jgi:hypothetical protein